MKDKAARTLTPNELRALEEQYGSVEQITLEGTLPHAIPALPDAAGGKGDAEAKPFGGSHRARVTPTTADQHQLSQQIRGERQKKRQA